MPCSRYAACLWVVAPLTLSSQLASAYPYEVYAKYASTKKGAPALTVPITGDGTTVVPSDPRNAAFQGLFWRAKKDPLARSELSRLENVLVLVCAEKGCGSPDLTKSPATAALSRVFIPRKDLLASTPEEHQIYAPQIRDPTLPVASLVIEVFPKFTQDYLCDQERRVREGVVPDPGSAKRGPLLLDRPHQARRQAKQETSDQQNRAIVKQGDTVDAPYNFYAYGLLFTLGLKTDSNEPIIYSFCPRVYEAIDWPRVAALTAFRKGSHENEKDGSDVHAQQKSLMTRLVVQQIKTETGEDVLLARLEDEPRNNLYLNLSHRVALLQDISDLELSEVDGEGAHQLGETVDKASKITLRVKTGSHFCAGIEACNHLIGKVLQARISYTDKKGNVVNKDSSLESQGNEWTIAPNLADNMGDELTISVAYFVDTDTRLELLERRPVRVENLGLITTFPVITEVVSAISKNATKVSDISSQSTIPLSWAINVKHGEPAHAAVTFPWMIGYNSRSAPRLADVIKVFPHVTVIFPLQSDTTIKTPRVAFGAGVALANAFTFSFATTIEDVPQQFFLVGISAPDLVKILSQ